MTTPSQPAPEAAQYHAGMAKFRDAPASCVAYSNVPGNPTPWAAPGASSNNMPDVPLNAPSVFVPSANDGAEAAAREIHAHPNRALTQIEHDALIGKRKLSAAIIRKHTIAPMVAVEAEVLAEEIAGLREAAKEAKQALIQSTRKYQDGFDCVPFCELAGAMKNLLTAIVPFVARAPASEPGTPRTDACLKYDLLPKELARQLEDELAAKEVEMLSLHDRMCAQIQSGRERQNELEAQLAAKDARARELETLHQKCLNSVVEASLAFPNVGAYIKQLEGDRDYFRDYVVPQKDRYGKYWHDLAQERIVRVAQLEAAQGGKS